MSLHIMDKTKEKIVLSRELTLCFFLQKWYLYNIINTNGEKKNDKYYHELVKAILASRKENKELVIQSVSRILGEILK